MERRCGLKKPLLMIPGPTEASKRVLKVLSHPIVPHYGEDWKPIYDETISLLKKLFKTSGHMFIIPGAGSLAVEISAINTMDEGMKIAIPSNGYFGERLQKIFSAHGEVLNINFEWGEEIDLDKVEEKIAQDHKVKALAAVHCETSTGMINPIEKLGRIAAKYNLIYIVDAISSIGGMEFKMDEWNVDITFVGPQKCLGAIAGITPVAVSEKFWKYLDNRVKPVPSWYLNLKTWRDYVKKSPWHPYPSTLSSPLIIALREALLEIFEEGLEKRFERHVKAAKAMRTGLKELGFKVIAKDENASSTVTAALTPENVKPATLISKVLKNHNILISSGLGKLREKAIRVGHMANTATLEHVLKTINAIGEEITKLGLKTDVSRALKKVEEAYEECGK
ncbi:MAG: hypothetical protein DRJ26_03590 [Candidatus Methanomethylicota archaeon]|uniref:Aminotransferase class V domain-containing protein n=1 Tax=Thermoproteota archaeon TaxID=2056631 RepID=A0A497F0S5_9CREN|nr:MAG: hypothetical protein DRJ26_03590 [Candidatus Verstraetearchaeota archaeon]